MNTPDTEWEKVFDEVFRDTLGLDEPFNNLYLSLHLKPALKSFITNLLTSRDTYWKERVRKWVDENEYCSECCSPKKYCMEWGEHASAIDTNDLLQALDNLK